MKWWQKSIIWSFLSRNCVWYKGCHRGTGLTDDCTGFRLMTTIALLKWNFYEFIVPKCGSAAISNTVVNFDDIALPTKSSLWLKVRDKNKIFPRNSIEPRKFCASWRWGRQIFTRLEKRNFVIASNFWYNWINSWYVSIATCPAFDHGTLWNHNLR